MILPVDVQWLEPETFKNVDSWMQMLKDKAGDDIHVTLVGNKLDLAAKR